MQQGGQKGMVERTRQSCPIQAETPVSLTTVLRGCFLQQIKLLHEHVPFFREIFGPYVPLSFVVVCGAGNLSIHVPERAAFPFNFVVTTASQIMKASTTAPQTHTITVWRQDHA